MVLLLIIPVLAATSWLLWRMRERLSSRKHFNMPQLKFEGTNLAAKYLAETGKLTEIGYRKVRGPRIPKSAVPPIKSIGSGRDTCVTSMI